MKDTSELGSHMSIKDLSAAVSHCIGRWYQWYLQSSIRLPAPALLGAPAFGETSAIDR